MCLFVNNMVNVVLCLDFPIENLNVDFLCLRAKNGKSGNGLFMGQGKLS